MPAIANLVLANGETTPVNHTFIPIGQDPKTGIWWFEDQAPRITTTSSLGFPRIGVLTKREVEMVPGKTAKSSIARVQLTIALPQLETLGTSSSGLTPSQTIAYVDRAKMEFMLSSRDLIADRKDALAYAKSLLAHATPLDLVTNLTTLY